jgi:hypothetical protein
VADALATDVVQTWPQLPQLFRSVAVLSHCVGAAAGHAVRPAAQLRVHAPPLQAAVPVPAVGPGHVLPHAPQLVGSVCSSTHAVGLALGQPLKPVLHAKVHELLAQSACPFGTPPQTLPHALQFFGSLVVSVHVPLHSVGAAAPQPLEHA